MESLNRFFGRWGLPIICGLFFSILGFVLLAVVPKLAQMWREMDVYLPPLSAFLVACSLWSRRLWFLFAPAALGLCLLVSRVPPRRRWILEVALILTMGGMDTFLCVAMFFPRIHMFGPTD